MRLIPAVEPEPVKTTLIPGPAPVIRAISARAPSRRRDMYSPQKDAWVWVLA